MSPILFLLALVALVAVYFALVKSLSAGEQPGRTVMNVFLAILFIAASLALSFAYYAIFIEPGSSGGLEGMGDLMIPALLALAVAVISIGDGHLFQE